MCGVTLVTVAVTFTEVATVPALTTVCTCPLASLVAVAGVSVMPPTCVFSAKATGGAGDRRRRWHPARLNTTVALSGRLASPVPFNAMLVGVADMNEIEPDGRRRHRDRAAGRQAAGQSWWSR